MAENDVDVVTDAEEEGKGEGEISDGESELGEDELDDANEDEVRQGLMSDTFVEEDAKEIGECGYGDEDGSVMEEMEEGGFGEVLEDDRSTTDDGGYLVEL